MTYLEHLPTEEQRLDVASQTDNMRVQNYLEAWRDRHIGSDDPDCETVDAMIELLQETL